MENSKFEAKFELAVLVFFFTAGIVLTVVFNIFPHLLAPAS